MELNREQIIKDLECCKFGKDEAKCKECNWHPWIKPRCWRLLASNALSLIKELTEEVASWKEIAEQYQNQFEDCYEEKQKLTEENERLRGILLKFTDIVHKWGNKNGYDTSEISLVPILNEASAIKSQIEADTVKKMLSMMCEGRVSNDTVVIVAKQVAKEMLED